MASIRDAMRGLYDPTTGIDRGLLGQNTGFTERAPGKVGYWEGAPFYKYIHPGASAGVVAPDLGGAFKPFTYDPNAPPGPISSLAQINPDVDAMLRETGEQEVGSQTPVDPDLGHHGFASFDMGDVAKAALAGGLSLGLPGIGLVSAANTAFGNPIGGLFSNTPSITAAQLAEWGITPELSASFGEKVNDPGYGDWGPQTTTVDTPFGSFEMDSRNLDTVGGDFGPPTSFGLQGLKDAWDETFGNDPDTTGPSFSEMSDLDDAMDAGIDKDSFDTMNDRDEAENNAAEGPSEGPSDDPTEDDPSDENDGYAQGGIVKGLLGKNPPGPDDGYAALDRGEYVVRADAVKHYGADFFERLNERKILKKSARKLLG